MGASRRTPGTLHWIVAVAPKRRRGPTAHRQAAGKMSAWWARGHELTMVPMEDVDTDGRADMNENSPLNPRGLVHEGEYGHLPSRVLPFPSICISLSSASRSAESSDSGSDSGSGSGSGSGFGDSSTANAVSLPHASTPLEFLERAACAAISSTGLAVLLAAKALRCACVKSSSRIHILDTCTTAVI